MSVTTVPAASEEESRPHGWRKDVPTDRHDLVVLGALPPDHADLDADAAHGALERRDRGPALAVAGAKQVNSSPHRDTRPTRWLSPDWLSTGVNPSAGPTSS